MFGRNFTEILLNLQKEWSFNNIERIAREQGRALYFINCAHLSVTVFCMHAYIYFVSFILQGFNFCGAVETFLGYRFQVVPCITADIAVVRLGCCHKWPQTAAHPMNSTNLSHCPGGWQSGLGYQPGRVRTLFWWQTSPCASRGGEGLGSVSFIRARAPLLGTPPSWPAARQGRPRLLCVDLGTRKPSDTALLKESQLT